jgi:hypothetical protein
MCACDTKYRNNSEERTDREQINQSEVVAFRRDTGLVQQRYANE